MGTKSVIFYTNLLVCFLISIQSSESTTYSYASLCIFGKKSDGCMLPCHCKDGREDACNQLSGKCTTNTNEECVKYSGTKVGIDSDVYSHSRYPWKGPGCQWGNIACGHSMQSILKHNESIRFNFDFISIYGDVSPQLCSHKDSVFQLDDFRFLFDFGKLMHVHTVQIESDTDTSSLHEAYESGQCRFYGQMSNSTSLQFPSDRKRDSCRMHYSENAPLFLFCDQKGRYFLMETSGCSPKKVKLTNYCVDRVLVYGNPVVDIDCLKCEQNDSKMLYTDIVNHINSVETPVNFSYLAEDISLSCGNGIWCERCKPGWLPPDCRKRCDIDAEHDNCRPHLEDIKLPPSAQNEGWELILGHVGSILVVVIGPLMVIILLILIIICIILWRKLVNIKKDNHIYAIPRQAKQKNVAAPSFYTDIAHTCNM